MSALDYINDKTPPFLGLENPMTALEFAIWFTDRGTTAVDMNIAAAELAALRERVEKLETERKSVFENVKLAQIKLQATQINWQENCLFDCNDILTGILQEAQ